MEISSLHKELGSMMQYIVSACTLLIFLICIVYRLFTGI